VPPRVPALRSGEVRSCRVPSLGEETADHRLRSLPVLGWSGATTRPQGEGRSLRREAKLLPRAEACLTPDTNAPGCV
jgi:hypothetical protein